MNELAPLQPGYSDEVFSYEKWRERFINVVLQGAAVFGLVAIVLYLFTPSTAANKLFAVLAYGALLVITYFSNLPHWLRAGSFLLLLYLTAASSLNDRGLTDASVLFLGFLVMTGLLFAPRPAVFVLIAALTLASILVIGWRTTALLELTRLTVIFAVVSAIIMTGLLTFQQRFLRTQNAARQSLESLRNERATLEQRVQERTAGLARKTEQLRATSYIARRAAEMQDLASLLDTVTNLVTEQFGFYHTGLFLVNETGQEAVLQAASSEGGRRMIMRGHSLAVGKQGIVGFVAEQKRPRIAVDVGADAVFFNNPDLPMTRSEIAMPLLSRDHVLGVLDIQSDKPQAFTIDDLDVLQALADQVAVAIENARLLDESQAALAQLEALTAIRTREAWSQKLQGKSRVFTYTPLGLRAEKITAPGENSITVPLTLRGQKIGTISMARRGNATITKNDEELISEVASQTGLAIDNIRLLEDATQRARQEQVVGKLAARFSQSLDIDTLLQTAVRELAQLPDVDEVSVFIGEQPGSLPARQRSRRSSG